MELEDSLMLQKVLRGLVGHPTDLGEVVASIEVVEAVVWGAVAIGTFGPGIAVHVAADVDYMVALELVRNCTENWRLAADTVAGTIEAVVVK